MSGDYDDGYDIGVRAVGRILRNLIAELRKQCDIDPYFDDEYCLAHEAAAIDGMVPCSGVQQAHEAAADRAEARLREVQGE